MKRFLLALSAILLQTISHAQTGIPVPTMVQTDNLIKDFLTTYEIPGATVAMAKDGKIVYMRAFGYSNISKNVATQPYNLFRIASLSKQVTSVAIMKLMQDGMLTMSTKVFGQGGILKDHPVFSLANITDNRIYDITIKNLLEHSAGWNRDINCNPNPSTPYPYFLPGCDAIDFPLRVTQLTNTSNPITKDALIKFILEKGLDFAPGTSYNYSNLGYLILGEVIEKLSGQSYEKYVRKSILAPLGIFDMHIGNNLLSEKQEREGEYIAYGYKTLSLYGTGTYVPWEYGGYNVNAMDSHGGWIGSSRDMLKLLTAVDGFNTKPDILAAATIDTMVTPSANNASYAKGWNINSINTWWHTGGLDGTACVQVRTASGYTWVIILNRRNKTNTNFGADLVNLGFNCIAATTDWPTWDLMESPTTNATDLAFTNVSHNALTVNWTNGNGNKRLLLMKQESAVDEFPLDGTDYTANEDFGNAGTIVSGTHVVYNGTGNSVTVTGLTPGANYFFRTVEYNNNAVTGNNSLYLLGNNPEANQTLVSVLPVNLKKFDARKIIGQKTRLTWETESELNADHYIVERSGDATAYTSIGILKSSNVSSHSFYSLIDEQPLKGMNYYRLNQFDKNGNHVYSNILLVDYNRTANNSFTIVSLPGKNQFNIIKPSGQSFNHATLTLRNAAGQTVSSHKLVNQTLQTINTNPLVKGIYFATIYSGDDVSTMKVLVP